MRVVVPGVLDVRLDHGNCGDDARSALVAVPLARCREILPGKRPRDVPGDGRAERDASPERIP